MGWEKELLNLLEQWNVRELNIAQVFSAIREAISRLNTEIKQNYFESGIIDKLELENRILEELRNQHLISPDGIFKTVDQRPVPNEIWKATQRVFARMKKEVQDVSMLEIDGDRRIHTALDEYVWKKWDEDNHTQTAERSLPPVEVYTMAQWRALDKPIRKTIEIIVLKHHFGSLGRSIEEVHTYLKECKYIIQLEVLLDAIILPFRNMLSKGPNQHDRKRAELILECIENGYTKQDIKRIYRRDNAKRSFLLFFLENGFLGIREFKNASHKRSLQQS